MRPAVEGWFTTGDEPVLVGSRCRACQHVAFPKETVFCKNPACAGDELDDVELSRRGRVWSYTDAQYQPPAPYVPRSDPYQPFAIAAVELPEGLVVVGQVADGFGTADIKVGTEVELVVEPLDDELLIWRWRPLS